MTGLMVRSVGLLILSAWGPADGTIPSYSMPAGIILRDGATFDYVVVGGGAAGGAAAARLALSLVGRSVLLVEAGGDPGPLARIPSAALALLGSPLDWHYNTLPNNMSCLSAQGQQCRFSRGRCLGGSTSINHMLYTRGNRRDYDDYNIPGWTWTDLEPYFLRYEGLQILDQFPRSSRPYHNTTGIVKLEFFNDFKNPWQRRIVDGFKTLQVPFNADVNGESQIGVTRATGFIHQGERVSTARAYLCDPAVKAKLRVAKNCYCTDVIIDAKQVARGVTVVQNSITKRIYARKQVILSAGTVETPKILLRSGIGPAGHLRDMGIPVVADLPVGENMSDHVLPVVIAMVDGETRAVQDVTKLLELGMDVLQFVTSRDGPLASNRLIDTNVFVNTRCYNVDTRRLETGPGCELPTMQLIHAYVDKQLVALGKAWFKHGSNLNDDVIDQIAAINVEYALVIFSPVVLKPFSRGSVRLAGSQPLDPPAIYPNYLSDERDVEEMMRSIQILEHLMETPIFKSQNASLVRLKLPGCPNYADDRDGYWRCYSRHMTSAVYHAVGTCSLQTCLDTRLRVRGVKRLRVADASIFPELMRGNTASPTIAVGERVVDFLLGKC